MGKGKGRQRCATWLPVEGPSDGEWFREGKEPVEGTGKCEQGEQVSRVSTTLWTRDDPILVRNQLKRGMGPPEEAG